MEKPQTSTTYERLADGVNTARLILTTTFKDGATRQVGRSLPRVSLQELALQEVLTDQPQADTPS